MPEGPEEALAGLLQQILMASTQRGSGNAASSTDLPSASDALMMRSGEIQIDEIIQGDNQAETAGGSSDDEDTVLPSGSPPSSSPSPGAEGDDIPATALHQAPNRQAREFWRDQGLTAGQIPTFTEPWRDEGASVEQLLSPARVRPVNISELNMVSRSRGRELDPGERTVVKVSNLLLVARLTRDAVPIDVGRFSLQIRDVEDHVVSVIVQLDNEGLDAREFATDIARRFTTGTTVAMRNIIMAIENDGYFLLLDMQDEDSEVFCCGDDDLPAAQVAQLASQVDHLVDMEEFSGALACSLEGMEKCRTLLVEKVAPLLTNLAIAHLKLGYKGVALAYAVAVSRLVLKDTPFKAATIAASILTELKYEHGPHVIMLKADVEDAGSEITWLHAVSKSVAKSFLSGSDVREASDKFRASGLRDVTDALLTCDAQWTSHALGDATPVQAAADTAVDEHEDSAAEVLIDQGKELFKQNAVAKAILKWRAAIWVLFHKQHSPDLYFVWDILNSRHDLWEKAEATSMDEARCDHLLDLAALAMLRSSHVANDNLNSNITLAKCKLGKYSQTAAKAVKDALAKATLELD